ncbi:hypothetical protein [Roseovarius sp. MMSF_3281]|uniref:hypothetical protein n=1 Tax=Roseovarius sp. MMSF_3281 TaxID=3046694 RepID=UPI00273EB03B|nr:hypothetical protein [Roseovarius sp. MMSF_3281]
MIPDLAFRYVPTILVALAVGGVGWWIYVEVKDRGYQECRAEVAEDTAETQEGFDANAARAKRLAIELMAAQERMTELERRLADEAANDPLADSPGLSVDSLRRLDRIR